MRILVSPELCRQHLASARSLLEFFVGKCKELCGKQFLVYNIHSLIHICDKAEQFSSLDNCSAFPIENYLQKLKGFVRHGNKPLAQIVKRLDEQQLSCKPEFKEHANIQK